MGRDRYLEVGSNILVVLVLVLGVLAMVASYITEGISVIWKIPLVVGFTCIVFIAFLILARMLGWAYINAKYYITKDKDKTNK